MSKKQLLEESTIRQFMKLANLEPLSDKFIKEELGYGEEDLDGTEDAGMPADTGSDADDLGMDDTDMGDDEMDVELDGGDDMSDVDPAAVASVMKIFADALKAKGIDIEVETDGDDEDMGDDFEMGDMDSEMGGDEAPESEPGSGSEEDEPEEDEQDEEEDDEEQEVDEGQDSTLSEDELVENVLARVTARLLSEAKKEKKKKSVKEKMKAKKEEKLEEEKHVVTHKKGENPLLKKGGNKNKQFKGEDQKMTAVKGKGKTGQGGHEWKPLKAGKNHIVTHDKGTNKLTSKGKNKS